MTHPPPSVAILLCTYNGADHLAEQLTSFETLLEPNWFVWASDDGSQDETLCVLEEFRERWGEQHPLHTRSGPQRGFAANFQSLACADEIDADYFAFADQDDIWEQHKLTSALRWLASVPNDTPALYCSRTTLIDAENRVIGTSPLFTLPPSFSNALVQNIGGGNTMVFNRPARRLIAAIGPQTPIASHDWWAYMVVSGCGGQVFYDPAPTIRYRQHSNNLVGTNHGLQARIARTRKLLHGRFKGWVNTNLGALDIIKDELTADNRLLLERFKQARSQGVFARTVGIIRSGVTRQTTFDNIGLIAASLFNRV